MKEKFSIALLCLLLVAGCSSEEVPETAPVAHEDTVAVTPPAPKTFSDYRNGDMIFIVSEFEPFMPYASFTPTKYNHCGVLFHRPKDGKIMVFSADKVVQNVPLEQFLAVHSQEYKIMRFSNADDMLANLSFEGSKPIVKTLIGIKYDYVASWDDEKMYNSELLWKFWKRLLNVELCSLHSITDYDISNFPADQVAAVTDSIVTPHDLMQSELLETVYTNN